MVVTQPSLCELWRASSIKQRGLSGIALATTDAGGFARSSPAKRKMTLDDQKRYLSKRNFGTS